MKCGGKWSNCFGHKHQPNQTTMKTIARLCFVFVVMLSYHKMNAQSFNLEPVEVNSYQVGLKANIPLFKNNEYNDVASMSGTYTVNFQIALKNNWSLYSEIPIIYAKTDYDSETGIGNLFFIIRKTLNESLTSRISLGTYLPTIGEESYLKPEILLSGNIYRIAQAFNAYTIYANYAYQHKKTEKPIFGFEVGPDVSIPKGGGETELFLHYGLKGGYKFNNVWLWSEFNGIMIVTESGADIKDRTINQLVLGGQYDLGKFKPAVFYSIPLKEYMREYLSGVIGFKLEFGI